MEAGRECVSISLDLSWFGYQGPRGLPGERGRPGPPGSAVSTLSPLGCPWALAGAPQELWELSSAQGHNRASPLSRRVLVVTMVLLEQLDPQ